MNLAVLGIWLVAACGTKETTPSETTTTTSSSEGATAEVQGAVVAAPSAEAAQVAAESAEVMALLASVPAFSAFVGGTDPQDGGEQAPCFTTTKKALPPTVTIQATGAAGCSVSAGEVALTRAGQVGDKFVLARLGAADAPVVVEGKALSGWLRVSAQVSGAVGFATADEQGTPFSADEACAAGTATCLVGCKLPEGGTTCASPVRVGVAGTATVAVKASAIEVTFDGSGSLWSDALGAAQTLRFGASTTDECAGEGVSTGVSLLYTVSTDGYTLSCLCPTAGTASSRGSFTATATVSCTKTPSASFPIEIVLGDTAAEYAFGDGCAVSQVASCGGEGGTVGYENANMKACGLGTTACTTLKTLLGCNADCSSCTTDGVDIAALSKALAALPEAVKTQAQILSDLTSGVAPEALGAYDTLLGGACSGP